MEGIFTLPYSEYDVVRKMTAVLGKADGYGFYIPASRQQKGVDFVILNERNGKVLRVQVKGSRSYHAQGSGMQYRLWFNNFFGRYERGNADLYVLYGLYPLIKNGQKVSTKKNVWGSVILCFNEEEMFTLLQKARTKKEKKIEKFFGLAFENSMNVYTERGFTEKEDLSGQLLKNYAGKLKRMLG